MFVIGMSVCVTIVIIYRNKLLKLKKNAQVKQKCVHVNNILNIVNLHVVEYLFVSFKII